MSRCNTSGKHPRRMQKKGLSKPWTIPPEKVPRLGTFARPPQLAVQSAPNKEHAPHQHQQADRCRLGYYRAGQDEVLAR